MGEYNIAPNTQIGKIIIDEKVYNDENAYHIEEEKYSRGGEFIENLVTDNMIEFCHRWFHLANIEEAIEDIDEFYNNLGYGTYNEIENSGYGDGKGFKAILPIDNPIQQAISFGKPKVTNALVFHEPRDAKYTYNKLMENYNAD